MEKLYILEVTFENRYLRDLSERRKEAEKILGSRPAQALRAFLSDFVSADIITDIPLWAFCRIEGKLGEIFYYELCPNTKLVCTHAQKIRPTHLNGTTDWGSVTRVKILQIEQNNGN